MNYGNKSTSKRRNALISKTSMIGKRAHVSFLRVLFISLLALIILVIATGVGAVRGIIANSPNVNDVDIVPLGYASFLYDDEGNQIRKLAAPNANRLPVSIDKIPIDLQHAVVAIEDERFYEHNGIDARGILRAATRVFTHGSLSEGASTITQQLLKNNVFTGWTKESSTLERITRKLQEQYLAVEIEKKIHNKDIILENYLNTINLGAGTYGVQAAARAYFNKNVWELNLSECATLAGITQNPSRFNPILHPEQNAKRRKEVLQHMLKQGYIDQSQYDSALNDNVYAEIQAAQEENSQIKNTVYTYFEDAVAKQVINDLMNIKGYTRTQARNMLYSGGLKIYTTQDPKIQEIVDEEYNNPSNYPANTQYALDFALTVKHPDGKEANYSKEMMQLYFQKENPDFNLMFSSPEEGQQYVDKYIGAITADGSKIIAQRVNFAPQPQSSMTIIDQHNGYVKAIVGGRGEKTASLTLDRATDTTRQPGSTFKIVSTYAPALNEAGMTLATTFDDAPYSYPDGTPVNNAWRGFSGPTTIRKAIQNSVNVVAVKCLEEVTPKIGLEYLDRFGFTTLAHGTDKDKDDDGNVYTDAQLPTALGGITHGVTNLELCASYAAIANKGNYIKPKFYTRILDHNGNVLIENTSPSTNVVSHDTAWLLTSAMEDVVNQGTGTACQLPNMPVAGKTGTTEYYNDLWFVGYTPYYTCAVWIGNDNNSKLPPDERGFQQTLWRKVMTRIHEGLPRKEFIKPDDIKQYTICAETGLLAGVGCPEMTEYFAPGTEPTEVCHIHEYRAEPTETPSVTPSISPSANGNSDQTQNGSSSTTSPPTENPVVVEGDNNNENNGNGN